MDEADGGTPASCFLLRQPTAFIEYIYTYDYTYEVDKPGPRIMT